MLTKAAEPRGGLYNSLATAFLLVLSSLILGSLLLLASPILSANAQLPTGIGADGMMVSMRGVILPNAQPQDTPTATPTSTPTTTLTSTHTPTIMPQAV